MGDEWRELEAIYKKEARKKKSKFTPEELEVQSELVKRLYAEIEKGKGAQVNGYARSRVPDAATALNTKALAYDPSAARSSGSKPSWGGTGGGVALTSDQKQQMLQLEERDADFDLQLDEIGEGIQDLAEIAQQQGEEVRLQTQMKDTLEEVGRAGDKLMIDIMCIVLAIGFGAVIYNFVKNWCLTFRFISASIYCNNN